jgi:hypothetical protein
MVTDFVYKFQIVCLTLGKFNYGMENWKIGIFGKSRGITQNEKNVSMSEIKADLPFKVHDYVQKS